MFFKKNLWIYAALFAVTVAVYFQAHTFAFVNYDDPDYVTDNPHVRDGITADGVVWALTSGDAANWFPVTRISHMLDVQLFGMDSGAHHMVNVVLHAVAALLLFAFLNRATRQRLPSALVAAIFALHPLHVESVAWVSERKDVLCAVFWFLALWAYVRYTEQPGLSRYMLLAVAFGLGLMSKPMIVTLPFLLLIVDFWPLRRPPNVREKLPLFAMSAVAAVITVTVQKGSGAVESLAAFPLQLRIENALVSYLVYIANTFWPVDLAVFYPFSSGIPIWQPLLGALFIIVISALVVAFRKHPYLAAGWFWYLGTLVPVIGLVQVGTQAHADRYMYVPMVGLAIMWVWSAADGKVPSIVAAALVLCCIPLTWVQAAYWQNSGTLFERALAVTSNNAIAEHNLGSYLLDQPGRLPDAIDHLKAALRINPDSASIHSDLGSAYAKSLDIDEAMHEFQEALRLNPNSTVVRNNLANARTQAVDAIYNKGIDLMHSGNLTGAINAFEEVIRLRPDYAEAENNLGVALSQIPSRASEARAHFGAAVKLDPNNAGAHFNLGVALAQTPGHTQEAIVQLEAAYRLHPDPEVQKAIAQLKGK